MDELLERADPANLPNRVFLNFLGAYYAFTSATFCSTSSHRGQAFDFQPDAKTIGNQYELAELHESDLLSVGKRDHQAGQLNAAAMPGVPGRKLGQKVDIDFTLRKVFGRNTFRYAGAYIGHCLI